MKILAQVNKIAFILVVSVFVLLHLVKTNFTQGAISETENRALAQRPPLSLLLSQPHNFAKQMEVFLNDNIGFRENYSSLNKNLDEKVFKIPYYATATNSLQTLYGKNEHSFMFDDWMIEKYQGKLNISIENREGLINNINNLNDKLKKKNVDFVIQTFADKETIYPELMPDFVIGDKDELYIDEINNILKENTNVPIVASKDVLLENKNNGLLEKLNLTVDEYYENPSNALLFDKDYDLLHYNGLGAIYCYQELSKVLNEINPIIEKTTVDDYKFFVKNTTGENKLAMYYDKPLTYRVVPFAEFKNFPFDLNTYTVFSEENKIYSTGDETKPNILVLRDSYFRWEVMYPLAQQGNTVAFIHYNNADKIMELVDYFDADIVVVAYCERSIKAIYDLK